MWRSMLSIILGLAVASTTGCACLTRGESLRRPTEQGMTAPVDERPVRTRRDLPGLGEESRLPDYLTYAALNNPGLEAAFNRWKAALERIPQARSLPDPRFNYTYFVREVETRVGPQEQKVGIAQMFPWFGKLELRGNVALHAANAERQRYEAAKLKLFHRVKKAYYEYYYIGQAIAITQENVRLMSDLEAVARTKYTAGAPTYAAMIKAQVELGKLEDQLRTLRDVVGPVAAELNAAMNRSPNAPIPVPKAIAEDDVAFSNEQLLGWLKGNNPGLRAEDFVAAKEKAAVDLAKRDYFPDITVGLEYIDTDSALMPDTRDSGKDPVVGMISVNLPIWRDRYRAAEREARARYEASLKERTDRENNLIANLEMALYGFREAERKIDLYRNALIPKANQSFEVTQQAYEAGKADFLDLIDAQRILLEFKLSQERALANRAQKLSEIEMLVGREVPRNAEAQADSSRSAKRVVQ